MKKVRKAVIPAAGFGTRFLPATKAMPKEMLPIVDKPAIQYIVEEIAESGIDQILIISGHAKRAIEDHFDSSPELEAAKWITPDILYFFNMPSTQLISWISPFTKGTPSGTADI